MNNTSNAKPVNFKVNKNAREIFASLATQGTRRFVRGPFGGSAELVNVQGRNVVHTYALIATHKGDQVVEFARISTPNGTGKMEVYAYNSKGAARFLGYYGEGVKNLDIDSAFMLGREAGFGMFRVKATM